MEWPRYFRVGESQKIRLWWLLIGGSLSSIVLNEVALIQLLLQGCSDDDPVHIGSERLQTRWKSFPIFCLAKLYWASGILSRTMFRWGSMILTDSFLLYVNSLHSFHRQPYWTSPHTSPLLFPRHLHLHSHHLHHSKLRLCFVDICAHRHDKVQHFH